MAKAKTVAATTGRKGMDAFCAAVQKATKLTPSNVRNMNQMPHIPTNVPQIDMLLGGELLPDKSAMVCPGLPRGRLGEVFGAESSGKTTTALKFAVAVQKEGGRVLYLDYEHALHPGYAKAIGVDFDNLAVFQPKSFEEGMKLIYMAIHEGIDLIVVDSVSAIVTEEEMARKFDQNAKVGSLAAAFARWLPKIVQWLDGKPTALLYINQTRANISMGSNPNSEDNTSGGKALKFFASYRLKTTRIRSEFVDKLDPVTLKKKRTPYGNVVQIKSIKNKMVGHQNHTSEIFIRYGYGVDEYLSLIESAIPRKVVTKKGTGLTYNGQDFKSREKLRRFLMEDPKALQTMRDAVMKALMAEAPEPISDDDDEFDEDDMVSELFSDSDSSSEGPDAPPSEETVEEDEDDSAE